MVFCAYCGKAFTRKEHLERHIPSHTNVKPHRCSACQLSFARRDLLQRHHSTYHEARDPMEPSPGGIPTAPGRTPIACQNCANAKTGCDKRVPCSRCAEKSLPCEARFARRSSKAAVRAAQASSAVSISGVPPTAGPPATTSPSFMDVDHADPKGGSPVDQSPETASSDATLDPRLIQESAQQKKSPAPPVHSHISPDHYPSPHVRVDGLDDFMHLGNDFMGPETSYQDLLVWPEYPVEIDVYPNPLSMQRADMPMPAFTDLGDMSGSESAATSSSRGSTHTRDTSILSVAEFDSQMKPTGLTLAGKPGDSTIPEFEGVIAADNAWPLARCNPPIFSGACPRTAIVHLEALEQKCRQENTWNSLERYLDQLDWDTTDLASVVPLTPRTRDKMLAITQGFLHKALDIHRGSASGLAKSGYSSPASFNFIVLPPSKILEYFLRRYVRSLLDYFPLVPAGCVDPNEMVSNNHASTLLVLLMIAQGAAAVPSAEARCLSAGLTETCRISLFDTIEKSVELCADPVALRCALLFTVLGAWSGDKWLMDIAMGQRGMYLSMLKHAGLLEPQPSMIPAFSSSTSTELQWRGWLRREAQNRLVYNWVMVDQELSLFHDTAPMLAITELQCPLPGPDLLWLAPSPERWLAAVQSVYGCTANVSPQLLTSPSFTPSLYDLFQDFLHDSLARRRSSLTPQQLRLVLHPLQSLLCHLRQVLSCFSDIPAARRTAARTVTKASTMLRLEEAQALLQRWYELSVALQKADPGCSVTRCNLVLYHLISLNAVTNFAEVERLARREGFDGSYWELALRHKRCIYQREEAVFHCGQVLRLLRLMPADRRPSWWGAALYRATLILWTDSLGRLDPNFRAAATAAVGKRGDEGGRPHHHHPHPSPPLAAAGAAGRPVAVDRVTPEDPDVIAYLWNGDGVAVLTRADGSPIALDQPGDVLGLGISTLDEGTSTRIGDGIRRKLAALGANWSAECLGGGGGGGGGAA